MVRTPLNVPVTSVVLIGTVIAFVPALGGAATPADANASTPTIAASAARPVSRRVRMGVLLAIRDEGESSVGRQAPHPFPRFMSFKRYKRPAPSHLGGQPGSQPPTAISTGTGLASQ